jgi:hypothetical protein
MSDRDDAPGLAHPDEGHTEEYPTIVGPLSAPGEGAGEPVPAGDEADEEWVVRATRGIRLAVPVAALLAVALVAAGFWGGAVVEKRHGSSGGSIAGLAARFRAGRAGAGGASTSTTSTTSTTGVAGAGGFGFGGGGFAASSAATGTISVVDGDTLYILSATGSLVKVTLSPSTTITRNAQATPVDLRPGDTVVVQGTTGTSGNVAATSVTATAPGVSSGGGGFGSRLGGAAGATTTTTAGA